MAFNLHTEMCVAADVLAGKSHLYETHRLSEAANNIQTVCALAPNSQTYPAAVTILREEIRTRKVAAEAGVTIR